MFKLYRAVIPIAALLLSAVAPAQEDAGQAMPKMVHGNERFGRKLLQQVHSANPTANVVVAPLSLSLVFAAIQSNAGWEVAKEISTAFDWPPNPLSLSAHMLLARFEQPIVKPCSHDPLARGLECYKPEGVWVTNTFLYRSVGEDPIAGYFEESARKYFGFKFVNIGKTGPGQSDLRRVSKSTAALPRVPPKVDALISSGVHIATRWRGNTFSMTTPHSSEFHTASGLSRKVEMLDSELANYFHAKTDAFEAVALPCDSVYMIAVLPEPGKDIQDLERQLVEEPDALDSALKKEIGLVTMPTFHMVFETDLHPAIEHLGIKSVFEGLGDLVKIPKSKLTKINQKVDLHVTKDGIQADAETVAGLVYGGIMAAPKPFHLVLNRPFLFLIRDQVTKALVLVGALMDPGEHP